MNEELEQKVPPEIKALKRRITILVVIIVWLILSGIIYFKVLDYNNSLKTIRACMICERDYHVSCSAIPIGIEPYKDEYKLKMEKGGFWVPNNYGNAYEPSVDPKGILFTNDSRNTTMLEIEK